MAKRRKTRELLPRRQARYAFVLTPLADAMFQLLIFFMLSSNLAPYSLLTIRSGSAGPEGAATQGQQPADQLAETPADAAIWSVGEGVVVAGGQSFGPDALTDLAEALALRSDASVVLILRDAAQVQDLTNVLEALTAAGVQRVQIAESGGV